ncbi:hypothetical protein [Kitasatospora cystarginea]
MELSNRHSVLIGAATAALAAAAAVGVSTGALPTSSHGIVVEAHMALPDPAVADTQPTDTTDRLVVPDHGYVQ